MVFNEENESGLRRSIQAKHAKKMRNIEEARSTYAFVWPFTDGGEAESLPAFHSMKDL